MFHSIPFRRIFAVLILCVAFLGVLKARGGSADSTSGWGFRTANLDKSCKPCDDFYEFAMGGWMKNNPIPPEFPSWGSFTILADRNQASMRGILEDSMKANPPAGSNQQKIGDYYASCMDTAAIDASGIKPIAADLHAIHKIKESRELQPLLAQLRAPHAISHKITLPQWEGLAPTFPWEGYFRERNAPQFSAINVAQPDFFKEANRLLTEAPPDQWKSYLRWHVIHANANELFEGFVQENFSFYGAKLSGSKEIQPRWKRCVQSVNRNLGEALGQVYVGKYFPPEAKAHAQEMVANLIGALKNDIPVLTWMGPETKKAALEKLQAFQIKIGYPDKWRDYSALSIERSGYLANVRRSISFEHSRDLHKIGKPVNRAEWSMTPPTVNAYYNSTMNEIVFPAGILQPPFIVEL